MLSNLALAEYLPDQSNPGGGLQSVQSAIPIVGGYGPVKAPYAISTALPAAFKGGGSFIANDGSSYMLVGTATGLVKYAGSGWTNLVTGMTVTGQWRFTKFGDFVVGVNGALTKVSALAGGVGTTTTLAGAPVGVAICTVGDYVVIAQGTNDLTGIYTSGFNNHTDWDVATGTATFQPMLTGGEVMGLAGGEYGIILQRQRVVRMTRTGDTTAPFQYDEISANVGCASKGSVASYGRTVFFLSDRGFVALDDGQIVRPIGSEKVDRTFQSRVPRGDYERIFSAIDPERKLVYWMVPGSPAYVLIYSFALDRWGEASFAADGLFSGFTSSIDLETLAVTYPDLDAMTISLDDPRWRGGSPAMYVVQNGTIGTFDGINLAARFTTSFAEVAAGRVTRAWALRPVSDGTTGDAIVLDMRARIGDVAARVSASALRSSGVMPVRASGRYTQLEWTKAEGAVWTYAQGVVMEYEAGGGR